MFKTIFDTKLCKLIQNTKTKISLGFPIRPLPDKSAIKIQIQIQILLGFPNFPSSPCLTNLPIELLRQCWGRRSKSPSYNFCGEGTRMYKNLSNKNFHLFTAFVKYLQFPCANSLLVNLLKGKLCWEDLTRLIQKVPSGNPLS